MSDRYAKEKLSVAMSCLAVSTASLQMRLANAGMSALVRLKEEDFRDGEERELFRRIISALAREEPHGPAGSIEMSAKALNDEEAMVVARDIADLHGLLMPLS
jgi:hypothetical protein